MSDAIAECLELVDSDALQPEHQDGAASALRLRKLLVQIHDMWIAAQCATGGSSVEEAELIAQRAGGGGCWPWWKRPCPHKRMLMYNASFTQTNVLSHVVRAVALRRDNRCRKGDQVFMKNVHAHSAARQGAISRGRVETRVGGEVV